MAIEYANSDPIKVTHTKGAMSDGQKYTNTLPWKVELTNDDLAYQEDIQNLQRQINALEADLTWRDPVETYEELPASGNDDGDVRLVTSTGVLYVWAGSEWVALNETQDPVKELTVNDYNYPENNPRYVALWLLDPGCYTTASGTEVHYGNDVAQRADGFMIVGKSSSFGKPIIVLSPVQSDSIFRYGYMYNIVGNGLVNQSLAIASPIDNLTTNYNSFSLSAAQGKVLNEKIGDLATLTTTDKTSAVAAINEIAANIPTAVSDLTNDAGYQTAADVAAAIAGQEVVNQADWEALFGQTIENVNGVGL